MRLALAAVAMLVAVNPASAQWKQDGKHFEEQRWSKADGDFGAQLFLTDKPDELFAAWEKPAPGVAISEAKTAQRGVPIVAVVVFTGCAPDAKGLCQATVEYAVYRPDGKPYGDPSESELWIDKPPPSKGQLQLGIGSMGIVIDPGDPLGVYKLRAKVVDKVANKTLFLERDFTAVEADPKSTKPAPAPRSAAKRVSIRDQVIGSWRSENVGLDFPIWMVDTYRADGTVITDVFSKPHAETVHHKDHTRTRQWRLTDDALEVGRAGAAGEFEREGMPRPLHVANDGILNAIDNWTRVEDGT